jgi:integrase
MNSTVIIKRRTKSGKLRYGVRVDRRGEQIWVGTFRSLAEARKEEAKARSSRRMGTMRCEEFADHFLEGYRERTKASTASAAAAALRPFKKEFRGIPLDRVTQVEAEKWARKTRWAVPVVITLFNAAKRAHLVDENPFSGLSKKGEGRRYKMPLTVGEVDELAQAADEAHGPDFGKVMRSLVTFLAYSGLRVGEAFALEWRDVDFEAMRIKVERRLYAGEIDLPKSNKRRVVVLTPQARDALLPLARSTDLIFNAKRGGRLSQSALGWYWSSVTAKFGRHVAPHELKHFAGWFLYTQLGLPARVVAVQLGHNDGGRLVQELYGHGDVGALEEIDRALGQNVVPIRKAAG